MNLTDAHLVKRAQDGEGAAFGLLFERHSTAIYNFCFRRVGDWSVAEDLLSIVFLVAWRRLEKAPPDNVVSWLYGIATNVVRNQRRAEFRYRRALARVRDLPEVQIVDDIEPREHEQTMRRVLSNVRRLPQHELEAFVLCVWMDLNYADAATALGVPVGTVRSRVARARRDLRELDPDFGHKESRTAIVGECESHEN